MKRPNLWGILDGTTVEKKGKHDFTPWAIVAKIVLEQLPEHQFNYEYREINGYCYFDCWWTVPGYQFSDTTKAPYAITVNNQPVKAKDLTSRVFTDNHRRAFAWSAAYTYGVGLELWTGDDPMFTTFNEIEESYYDHAENTAIAPEKENVSGAEEQPGTGESEKTDQPVVKKLSKAFAGEVVKTNDDNTPKNYKAGEFEESPIDDKKRDKLIQAVKILWDNNQTAYQNFDEQFRKKFNYKRGKLSDGIQTNAHAKFIVNHLSNVQTI